MLHVKINQEAFEALDEAVQAHYRKVGEEYVLEAAGIITTDERDRLKSSLEMEKNDHKKTKNKLASFNGLDPEEVQAQLAETEELRLQVSKKDGEFDKEELERIVVSRVNTAKAPLQRELDQTKEQNTTLSTENGELKTSMSGKTIKDALNTAAAAAKVVTTALPDISMYANYMEVNEHDGSVVTKEGIPGVQPGLTPDMFLTVMKETRPHWWEAAKGGGAGGSGSGGASGNNPWSKDHFNLTEQGRIVRENPEKASKLAAAVGVKL